MPGRENGPLAVRGSRERLWAAPEVAFLPSCLLHSDREGQPGNWVPMSYPAATRRRAYSVQQGSRRHVPASTMAGLVSPSQCVHIGEMLREERDARNDSGDG